LAQQKQASKEREENQDNRSEVKTTGQGTRRVTGGAWLTEGDRKELENYLRKMECSRRSVQEAMVFCLDLPDSSTEIVDCLLESLTIKSTPWKTKLARLYLVNDILHNAGSAMLKSGWAFRREFERVLPDIFEHVGRVMEFDTTDEETEVRLKIHSVPSQNLTFSNIAKSKSKPLQSSKPNSKSLKNISRVSKSKSASNVTLNIERIL